jgi:hypothetical protein
VTVAEFQKLLDLRWAEACSALGCSPKDIELTWNIGEHPHFQKPRGYGVTFSCGARKCHLRFADKILDASLDRIDGVVRHEIGHVVDFCSNKATLDQWARSRNVVLASTPERRADDIAHAIWGSPIRYDCNLLVQTTGHGVHPRPEVLGL